jgi:hypothetical protein
MGSRKTSALAALAAALLVFAASPPAALGEKTKDCTDHCAEKAAESSSCEDLENWRCDLFIWGCLAGCNIAKL